MKSQSKPLICFWLSYVVFLSSQRKTARQQCHFPRTGPSSEQPGCNALRGMTSTSLTGGSRLWSWWQQVVVMVVMVAAGCGHGGHGGSRLWSWWQQVVVMVAAGCGHGGSRLWCSRLWSWRQQVVVQQVVVMVAAGCGHGGSRLWSWW